METHSSVEENPRPRYAMGRVVGSGKFHRAEGRFHALLSGLNPIRLTGADRAPLGSPKISDEKKRRSNHYIFSSAEILAAIPAKDRPDTIIVNPKYDFKHCLSKIIIPNRYRFIAENKHRIDHAPSQILEL